MAQELEDAREGKVPQRPEPVSATSQSPNADAILASISPAPVVPSTPEPQVAPVAVPAPQVPAPAPQVPAPAPQVVAPAPQVAAPATTPIAPVISQPQSATMASKTASATPPAPAATPVPTAIQAPAATASAAPVFKVQVLASGYKLRTNDPQLKGQKEADFYQEGGLYKYTSWILNGLSYD